MKNLKLITLALAISVSSISFASTNNNEDPKSELRTQIIELLGQFDDTYISKDLEAKVVFTINNNSELVIVSVNSKNDRIQRVIKGKLNYKKVKLNKIEEGKIYHMPLIIVKE